MPTSSPTRWPTRCSGPTGLPDLGTLFPASDPAYAGRVVDRRCSTEVAGRVAAEGWWIGNVDVAIAAERPKLGPHVDAMAANVAAALDAARQPMGRGIHVAVRPKSGEGLGFVGRAEGIAVWAVALLNARSSTCRTGAGPERPGDGVAESGTGERRGSRSGRSRSSTR